MKKERLISTETGSFRNYYNNWETLKIIKDAGFDAYDFTMCGEPVCRDLFYYEDDYIERAGQLRKYADDMGLVCNQTHAPFPTAREGDEEYNRKLIKDVSRTIEISGILGAKICVVHPSCISLEKDVELYRKYVDVAKNSGVKIAIENMFTWDDKGNAAHAVCSDENEFAAFFDLLNDDTFVACLDLGHAELYGLNTSDVKIIEKLGNKIKALHIHDNDKKSDLHRAPFTMEIDFIEIFAALKKIGYDGDITFEACSYLEKLPKELFPSGVKFLFEIGRYLKSLL